MIFYLCKSNLVLINLNHVEIILIEESGYEYEARAYLPEGKYYVLERFDNMNESKKFMEYIFEESKDE
jgi:hypothetical protein